MGRKLTRRPHETPGLESTKPQNQYPPYMENQVPNMPQPSHQQQHYSEYQQNMPQPSHQQNLYPEFQQNYQHNQQIFYQQTTFQPVNEPRTPQYNAGGQQYDYSTSMMMPQDFTPQNFQTPIAPTQLLSNPLVASAAMQYGNALLGSGRKIVDQEIEKYVPVTRIKYYFAVDTAYVRKKLTILLFPFIHGDWTLKYDQNEPTQPRFDVNAPDFYIPSMAFLTYILLAGLILGTIGKFSPERLSIQASSALAWGVLELIVQVVTLYIMNISTNLRTLDLIAYSSYKYFGIIIVMLFKFFCGQIGYVGSLCYMSIAIAFFLMRSLKSQILSEPVQTQPDIYGMPQQSSYHQTGVKRRSYFLLFVALSQPFLIWWLSSNL